MPNFLDQRPGNRMMLLCAGINSRLVAGPQADTPPTADSPPHTGLIIGAPLGPCSKLYVLDSLLRPVPIGVPGELHISGVAAPFGALRPGLQGACFTANPFCEGPDSGSGSGSSSMLATGCVVRWLPAGWGSGLGPLELLGRVVRLICCCRLLGRYIVENANCGAVGPCNIAETSDSS
jgi:hypothetical protein